MIQTWEDFEKTFKVVDGSCRCHPGRGDDLYTQGPHLSVALTLARHRSAKRILEIGTAYGHTSVAFAKAVPEAKVFTVDVCKELGGYDTHSPYSNEVLPKEKTGLDILVADEGVRSRIDMRVLKGGEIPFAVRMAGPFDCAFIDGDHTWRRVVSDTKLALETLVDDGVAIWDDYQGPCPEVVRFVDTMNSRAGDLISIVKGTRVSYAIMTKERKAKIMSAIDDL